jgi:hypothetical protein
MLSMLALAWDTLREPCMSCRLNKEVLVEVLLPPYPLPNFFAGSRCLAKYPCACARLCVGANQQCQEPLDEKVTIKSA